MDSTLNYAYIRNALVHKISENHGFEAIFGAVALFDAEKECAPVTSLYKSGTILIQKYKAEEKLTIFTRTVINAF